MKARSLIIFLLLSAACASPGSFAAGDQPANAAAPSTSPAPGSASPASDASNPPGPGNPDASDLQSKAAAITDRARAAYRDCTSYSAYIEMIPRSIREGSDQPDDRPTYFIDFAFTRAGLIRSHTTEEMNGIDGDRCWCAMPDDHEWMEAALPEGDERARWIGLQHWIPYVGLGLWKSIAGLPDAPPCIITDLASITAVRERDYDGRPATEIVGASPHPWRSAEPPVETIAVFDKETGTLREISWDSTELQRDQDLKSDENPPRLKKAWYVLKVSRERINEPLDAAMFAPPADYKKVPLLSGPHGYSTRLVGKTVPGIGGNRETPDLNRAMFKDKVWILYVGLLGDDLDEEPGILSMEWLHDTLSPRGLNVLSVANQFGPRDLKKARAWATAHELQHRTIAGSDGTRMTMNMGFQSYWPVILLVDGEATVQAAFTGYSPAFSLALHQWATKLLGGQKIWTDDELKAWREAAEAKNAPQAKDAPQVKDAPEPR